LRIGNQRRPASLAKFESVLQKRLPRFGAICARNHSAEKSATYGKSQTDKNAKSDKSGGHFGGQRITRVPSMFRPNGKKQ